MHFTLLNSPFKALYSVVRFRLGATLRNLEHSQRNPSPTTKTFLKIRKCSNSYFYEIVKPHSTGWCQGAAVKFCMVITIQCAGGIILSLFRLNPPRAFRWLSSDWGGFLEIFCSLRKHEMMQTEEIVTLHQSLNISMRISAVLWPIKFTFWPQS